MAKWVGAIPAPLQHLVAQVSRDLASDRQDWILSVMDRCGPAVVLMLWRILAHEQDVLDAYQECICRLIARRRPILPHSAHRYLYRTAANIAVDLIRRRQVLRRHQDPLAHHLRARQDTRPPDQSELIALLRAAIVRLPAHLRDVILLRDLAQMPYRRVASILGVTAGTARVYRRQAIIRLAELLDANEVRP